MPDLMKALKTSKRRFSQQMKVAFGRADVTSDATYDIIYRQFCDLEKNLTIFNKQCLALIANIENWCDTNRKLANELKRFTNTAGVLSEDMENYKDAVTNLDTVLQAEYFQTRRALCCVLRNRIINRIDSLLKNEYSQIQKVVKARENIITDYDSHRQKCSQFERKGDSEKADRFRRKAEHDKEMLDEHTAYLEERFKELIDIGSTILRVENGTFITCEMYLVKRQYEAMVDICNSFGTEMVSLVTSDIDDVIARIQQGENVEASYQAPELDFPPPKNLEIPRVTDFKDVPKERRRSSDDYDNSAYESYNQPRKPLPPTRGPRSYVIALYPLEAEDEGELSFNEGDRIEVLRKDPSVGLFPENYTQPE